MMSGLVLVTGGTGKTGRRLVSMLQENGVAHRIAARKVPPGDNTSAFDWTKPESWDASLDGVSAVYLVAAPAGGDPAEVMTRFVDTATKQGVTRFVLLSSSQLPVGGPGMGKVHLLLQQQAQAWAVLRPSWFMQNFTEGQHLSTIRDEDTIYSATENGRVPFISADDIAGAAYATLTRSDPYNSDYILTSDKPISYDYVADQIGAVVGRKISHQRLSVEELAKRHQDHGLPPIVAQMLAGMDKAISTGAEDRTTDCVRNLTGHAPVDFRTFAEQNASVWSS